MSKHKNKPKPQRKCNLKTLVLNKAYLAIDIVDWEVAIADWFCGTADIIESYTDKDPIRSGLNVNGKQIVMPVPSIVYRNSSSKSQHALVKTLPYNRANLYERDKGRCIYCKKALTLREFTIEHVIPQHLGGLSDWINCRVCCSPCNLLKGGKTIQELGWEMPKKVSVPMLTKKAPKNIIMQIGGKIPQESWRPYIYWEWKLD
jgi:5-methylcytosine-specific restriction endonuclease McrA